MDQQLNPLYGDAGCRDFLNLYADSIVAMPDVGSESCRMSVVFLSLFGRDTAVNGLLGRLSVGPHDQMYLNGVWTLSGVWTMNGADAQFLVIPQGIGKLQGKMPEPNLFGSVGHLMLYNPLCARPDMGAREAFLLVKADQEQEEWRVQIWKLVTHISPLPLLVHWRDLLLYQLYRSEMLVSLRRSGRLCGWHVRLGIEYELIVTRLVREGWLTTDPARQPALDVFCREVFHVGAAA